MERNFRKHEIAGKIDLAVVHSDDRRRDVARSVLAHDLDEVLKIEQRVIGSASAGKTDILYAVLFSIGYHFRDRFRIDRVKVRYRAFGFG